MENFTTDALFDGQLLISQSKSGYRFSIDPVILAYFASPMAGSKIIDLGTGCGVIPLVLAHRETDLRITGVEVQSSLVRHAKANVLRNDKDKIVDIVHMDMKQYQCAHPEMFFDLVITNPPYTKKNAGRVNPDSERAVARHEIKITLSDIIDTASGLLKDQGMFVIIFPEARLAELLAEMTAKNLNPEKVRLVYTKKGGRAKLVLVSGKKNSNHSVIYDAPLIIYDLSGKYTQEMAMMLR